MPIDEHEYTDLKVDVGVLKTQIFTLSQLCEKMDKVIDRLVEAHDNHINQVYREMERKKKDTDNDIGELHDRIDKIVDKVQSTEVNLMKQIQDVKNCITQHNKEEKEALDSILRWKWMIAGGIIVVSWIIAHGEKLVPLLTK
jgi:chromosome segregation ATPase